MLGVVTLPSVDQAFMMRPPERLHARNTPWFCGVSRAGSQSRGCGPGPTSITGYSGLVAEPPSKQVLNRLAAFTCAGLMLDLGRTSHSNLAGENACVGSWDVTTACSALGNAEGVSYRHQRDAGYARRKVGVNVSRSSGDHHVSANLGAARRRRPAPRPSRSPSTASR